MDVAAEYAEIWQFASQLEGHLTEVEDWDLGAGIYIEFLTLKSSFKDTSNVVEGLVCDVGQVARRELILPFECRVEHAGVA